MNYIEDTITETEQNSWNRGEIQPAPYISERLPYRAKWLMICDENTQYSGVSTVIRENARALEATGQQVSTLTQSDVNVQVDMENLPLYPGIQYIIPTPWNLEKAKQLITSRIFEIQPNAILNLTPEGPIGHLAAEVLQAHRIPALVAYTTHLHKFVGEAVSQKMADQWEREKNELQFNPFAVALLNTLSQGTESIVWNMVTKPTFFSQERVLVPTAITGNQLTNWGLLNPDQVVVWPRGVDHEVFHPPSQTEENFYSQFSWFHSEENPLLLVFHSRLDPDKNLSDLPLEIHHHQNRPVHWVIIGEGSERAQMEAYYRHHSHIHFLGFLKHNQGLERALRWATAGIYSTLDKETNGNVVIEAIASGIPVLVPENGATLQHVVMGINGTVHHRREHQSFQTVLDQLLQIREQNSAEAIAETVSHYRWDNAAKILQQAVTPIMWT